MSLNRLTSREIQVMLAIASDYSNKEIANLLCLSVKTIEGHRSRLFAKIKRNSSVGVTRYAIAHGFVSLADELKK